MRVAQIMTRNVETITPESTVWAAAEHMRDLNIGFLAVCSGDEIAGVLTDRDIAIRAVAEGLDPVLTPVAEVMTPNVVTCFEAQPVEVAMQLMSAHQIRRLLVLDQHKNLVGVISLGDLAIDALNDDQAGQVLQTISWPARPERQAR